MNLSELLFGFTTFLFQYYIFGRAFPMNLSEIETKIREIERKKRKSGKSKQNLFFVWIVVSTQKFKTVKSKQKRRNQNIKSVKTKQ
jgi:hypothetical protein